MTEVNEMKQAVTAYLIGLGFDESSIASEVGTGRKERIDFVIYRKDQRPLAIIELKARGKDYPKSKDSKLRFHPFVRQAQFLADELKAPYYSVSDGFSFYWFTTDSSGWPRLLEHPITPSITHERESTESSQEDLTRSLQELQQFLFWRGGTARPEETAIVILAKLMSELGNDALSNTIIDFREQTSMPLLSEIGFSPSIWNLVRPHRIGKSLSDALKVISHINFTSIEPRIVLSTFDKTILGYQADRGPWRIDRWLADFMAQLARSVEARSVLDLSASYGDILAAVRLNNPNAELAGIIRHPLSALWAQIQQLLLKNMGRVIFSGDQIPRQVMMQEVIPQPDCIITAPSFGAKVQEEYDRSILSESGVRHVEDLILELALEWVAPNGRIVILVPDGLLFAGGKRQLTRHFILNNSSLRAVISLAPGLLSSTSVLKSSVLVLENKALADLPVFVANLDSFEEQDTFDSREISSVREVLDQFWEFESGLTISRSTPLRKSRVLQSAQLDPNDLTAAHYLSATLEEKQRSRYPILSLERVAKKLTRGRSIRLRENGEVPVIGPAVIRSLELDRAAIRMASRVELLPNAPTVDSGDVLLNLIGTHLGEASLADPEMAGIYISQHVALVRPNTSVIEPEYLAIALNSKDARQQIEKLFTGALIKGLPLHRLKQLTIPVPDLDTQREIIAAIRKVKQELDDAKRHAKVLESKYLELVRTVTSEGVPE